jgi:DNA-binding GntR family transcriptional regulator
MKKSSADVAYDYIRKHILSGKYPPGHDLVAEALSAEIEVSRTPVREALRQLEVEELVSIRSRRGATVKQMDLKEFREMCDIRLALESHAAGLAAANRNQTDLREIQRAFDAMRGRTARILAGDPKPNLIKELVHHDVCFHIAIMTAARSELMKKKILGLYVINRVVSGESVPPGFEGIGVEQNGMDEHHRHSFVLESHAQILRAISERKPVAARDAMARHIQDIIDITLRTMARTASRPRARRSAVAVRR